MPRRDDRRDGPGPRRFLRRSSDSVSLASGATVGRRPRSSGQRPAPKRSPRRGTAGAPRISSARDARQHRDCGQFSAGDCRALIAEVASGLRLRGFSAYVGAERAPIGGPCQPAEKRPSRRESVEPARGCSGHETVVFLGDAVHAPATRYPRLACSHVGRPVKERVLQRDPPLPNRAVGKRDWNVVSCYVVTFEPGKGCDADALESALKEGGVWARITPTAWAVMSDSSATALRDSLSKLVGTDGRLFVIRSGVEAAWRHVMCSSEWLKKYL